MTYLSTWFFFSAVEDLHLRFTGTMESNGIRKLYEPSPVSTLYIGKVEDILGQVPLFPCFLDGSTASTIPNKYAVRQGRDFACCCADGPVLGSHRGSHVYGVNTWLWNFGLPQPRVACLSVAKAEKIRKKCRGAAAQSAWETLLAASVQPRLMLTYDMYIPVIYHWSVKVALCALLSCHMPLMCLLHVWSDECQSFHCFFDCAKARIVNSIYERNIPLQTDHMSYICHEKDFSTVTSEWRIFLLCNLQYTNAQYLCN